MSKETNKTLLQNIPSDLKRCVLFHGHLCPGLVYGYRVAKEAVKILRIGRSEDEEIVAICENDSCAVDAIQVLLGATAGKGNLLIKNYGKNAYIIFSRTKKRAYRFSRKIGYEYKGRSRKEFARLEEAVAAGRATQDDWKQLKRMKVKDLLFKSFDEIFSVEEQSYEELPHAPLARSFPCAECGEMTMLTKMRDLENGQKLCIPCWEKLQNP